MIVYLDASALVKRYVVEPGSSEVKALIGQAEVVGTSLISRAEVSAGLAKAIRTHALTTPQAETAAQLFRLDWPDLARLQLTEMTVARADTLAWVYSPRGYDSVHLASALLWQEVLGEAIPFATFDRHLWQAASQAGCLAWPESLEAFLSEAKAQ